MPGLYIHIPFCVRKCLYCDFYSLPAGSGPLPVRLAGACGPDTRRFLDALERELADLPDGFRPETVFVGGGTPTELADSDFARLFALLRERVDLSAVEEWTCESNPGTLTEHKARVLRAAGVNRMSLGVQSFDPRNLEFLGRIHSADEAAEAFALLRRCGFDNINLDLMYAVPGAAEDALDRDLDRLLALSPEHVACYALIFEDGTPLAGLRDRGFVKEVDDEVQLLQYRRVRQRLAGAGYAHYEISNFARPGRACRHNILYWSGGAYVGCGPSAHSHWDGARAGNVRDLGRYCAALLDEGRPARDFEERLDPEAKARETLVMSLRRLEGVAREDFRSRTGFDFMDLCGAAIARLEALGLLASAGGRLRLTDAGLFVSDGIFSELL